LDKLKPADYELTKKDGWFDAVLDQLPYREFTNFVVDPSLLQTLSIFNQDIKFNEEKIYAYACFLP